MKYMGSKNRHAKHILPIILKNRHEDQYYVEPFVGGANLIDKVKGNRIGGDTNKYLIALLKKLADGWVPPINVTKEEYLDMKMNFEKYPDHLLGYAGFQLSFGSKWFDSYRRNNTGRRDYSAESYRNVTKQSTNLKGIDFRLCSFEKLEIPERSLIYCDPPYKNTAKYKGMKNFDYDLFWSWCEKMVNKGHDVFVSEYQAPNNWVCLWEKTVNGNLSKNTGSKKSIERLFKLK